MKRLIKVICLFLVTLSVSANNTSGKSVQWQRIDLENKLRENFSFKGVPIQIYFRKK